MVICWLCFSSSIWPGIYLDMFVWFWGVSWSPNNSLFFTYDFMFCCIELAIKLAIVLPIALLCLFCFWLVYLTQDLSRYVCMPLRSLLEPLKSLLFNIWLYVLVLNWLLNCLLYCIAYWIAYWILVEAKCARCLLARFVFAPTPPPPHKPNQTHPLVSPRNNNIIL